MQKRTNIVIDQTKLNKAKKLAGLRTARETVDYALGRIIGSTEALKRLFALRGKVHFNKKYNYKALR